MIEVEELTVAYGKLTVLEEVTLRVGQGEFLAIIGPNGSGKTTLLRTMVGLIRPKRGTVRICGRDSGDLRAVRSKIGYVPQLTSVDFRFPVRVADVVMMGRYGRLGLFKWPRRADREATARALDRVGMGGFADRQIGKLSGGQRQRVFVARALVSEPRVLLLDEPTTGTDAESTETLYELLDTLNREERITIVLVSHDVGVVAQHVDTVACLNRRLVAHGRPGEVLDRESLACMYGGDAMFFGHGDVPHMVVERK
jgi:ABC-type Mn2+/Zn2+ transport system ATPase subunit